MEIVLKKDIEDAGITQDTYKQLFHLHHKNNFEENMRARSMASSLNYSSRRSSPSSPLYNIYDHFLPSNPGKSYINIFTCKSLLFGGEINKPFCF